MSSINSNASGSDRWERAVPVYGFPVVNPFFLVLVAMTLVAFLLTAYRELAGLGPVSGMNDAFGWGIWKTFNVMVLTALGSGAFAVGIAAWVFRRKRLHSLMRMALLTSFLAYACGLLLLGIDAGRPWNFYWIVFPWKWNMHSPLAEVAICMSIYAMIPLAVENIPPVLETALVFRFAPAARRREDSNGDCTPFFPWIIAAAYLLPGMHQSSLGALMLLAGERVHPLWQTPWLPLLYLGAATLHVVRMRRRNHHAVLPGLEARHGHGGARRSRPHHGLADLRLDGWRLLDILSAGVLGTAFHFDRFAGVFWLEMILVLGGWMLRRSLQTHETRSMFLGYIFSSLGGMIYRFSPTTLAFRPNPSRSIFRPPSKSWCRSALSPWVAGFLLIVKRRFAILPAPLYEWHDMASYFRFRRPYIRWTGYFKYGHFGETNLITNEDSELTAGTMSTNESRSIRSRELKVTSASMSRSKTMRSAMHGLPAPCGAGSRRFCAAATRAMRGSSPSVSAASAPRCTPWRACARWKTHSSSKSRQRPVYSQSDPDCPRAARSHRPLLPAVGARLGRHYADSRRPIRRPPKNWRRAFLPGRAIPAMNSKRRRTK
jgi:hypothetical protein